MRRTILNQLDSTEQIADLILKSSNVYVLRILILLRLSMFKTMYQSQIYAARHTYICTKLVNPNDTFFYLKGYFPFIYQTRDWTKKWKLFLLLFVIVI